MIIIGYQYLFTQVLSNVAYECYINVSPKVTASEH